METVPRVTCWPPSHTGAPSLARWGVLASVPGRTLTRPLPCSRGKRMGVVGVLRAPEGWDSRREEAEVGGVGWEVGGSSKEAWSLSGSHSGFHFGLSTQRRQGVSLQRPVNLEAPPTPAWGLRLFNPPEEGGGFHPGQPVFPELVVGLLSGPPQPNPSPTPTPTCRAGGC